jgi:hypothetical protein
MPESIRLSLACRIRDLLLQEVGEAIDVPLMLGPHEYALAVLSLCRSARNPELRRLGDQFRQASADHIKAQRPTISSPRIHSTRSFQGLFSSINASPSAT